MKPKIFCIIPARGGSKRIPRKNVHPLGGIPLISHTIRAARNSGMFERIMVSSDDDEILEVAAAEGAEPDRRVGEFAGDKVTVVQVAKHYLDSPDFDPSFQTMAILLPTAPFRTAQDMKNAVALWEAHPEHHFLVSVTEYDFPIQLALAPKDDDTVTMVSQDGYKVTRSQDIQPRYHPNGALYLFDIEAFRKNGSFFASEMLSYKMPASRSIDIDYPHDFIMAEHMLSLMQNGESADE